jgi:hypothetical protein
MRVLPDRVTAILQYPPPANLKTLRRFMGMVGFYGRFIPEFSRKSAVLHDLKKKGVHFEWRAEHQAAFECLTRALSSAPVLQIPDFGKDIVLATDVSERAISAVLQQRVGDDLAQFRTIAVCYLRPSANTVCMRRNASPYCSDVRRRAPIWNIRNLSYAVTSLR